MNRILMLVLFAFLSFSIATAAAAETAQKQQAEKPAAAKTTETKPAAAKPAETKPEAAKTTEAKPAAAHATETKPEETSVLLNAPLFSTIFREVPIASVDDEVIPLRELNEALFTLHEGSKEGTETVSKVDYKTILDRIINIKLINMEAKDMGLDQDPEVQDDIKKNADGTLRGMLKERQTKDIVPDKDLVEKFYKEAVKEWKIKSLIFAKEDDAKKMAADLKGGKDFNELVKKALADKTAKGGEEGYLRPDKLLPQVAAEVVKLKVGEVTPVIKVPEGYSIAKAEDIRYPENDESARKDAETKAINVKAEIVLKNYFADLKKKYVVVNQKLFKSLNFEKSAAKFEKFFDDKRPLIKMKGDKPITVGQYTEALNTKFFHGVERAIQEKRVNAMKEDVLNEILAKLLFLKEAKAQGIDKTDEYKDSLARYERSILFAVFIKKVVVPDIKITEAENKKYYEDHISDYTTPEMMKLSSLGFYKMKDAEDTLKKLQRGDDFKWLRSNAPGQIKANEGDFLFDGNVFTVTGLDEGLKKALTGAKAGDYRIFSDGKFSYVININEEIPSQAQTYLQAREETAKKVFNEKLNQSVQDWTDKLRKAHKVKVYITGLSTTTE
jgi:parvulin-like peptidyl-prolyl isomerase